MLQTTGTFLTTTHNAAFAMEAAINGFDTTQTGRMVGRSEKAVDNAIDRLNTDLGTKGICSRPLHRSVAVLIAANIIEDSHLVAPGEPFTGDLRYQANPAISYRTPHDRDIWTYWDKVGMRAAGKKPIGDVRIAPQERSLLFCAALGMTMIDAKSVMEQMYPGLSLSPQSYTKRMTRIEKKLGVLHQAQAVAYAGIKGIFDVDQRLADPAEAHLVEPRPYRLPVTVTIDRPAYAPHKVE